MSTTVEQAPKQDQSVLSYLFSLSPFESAHRLGSGRVPCARDSLLLGMGTAAAVGAVGTVAGRGIRKSLNWGVGAFVFVSLASWHTCRSSRLAERARVKTIIEDYNKHNGAKQAQE